jgi:toxin ParE1/3/4
MGRLRISPEAEHDLLEIWLYIAEDSPENADRFLDRLVAVAERLVDFPDLGRERSELAEGIRSTPLERYVLFYLLAGYGARDLNQLENPWKRRLHSRASQGLNDN